MKIIQKGLLRVCFQLITMLNCCTTCISWEIGSYNTQQSHHNEHTHFCRTFVAKSAIWFSENEGGDQRPFGSFPKIHPFWWGEASLNQKLYISGHGENHPYNSGGDEWRGESWRTTSTRSWRVQRMGSPTLVSPSASPPSSSLSLSSSSTERFTQESV